MIAMQAIEDSMRRESAALQKLESQLASLQCALHPLGAMPCPSLLTDSPETQLSMLHMHPSGYQLMTWLQGCQTKR